MKKVHELWTEEHDDSMCFGQEPPTELLGMMPDEDARLKMIVINTLRSP